MKRIYMAIALVGALTTGANAQKALKIEFVKPTANQTFTNTPDSVYYQFKITNNGPDAVNAAQGDTLSVMVDIQYFGCVLQNIKWLKIDIPANIPAGQSGTYRLTTELGGQFWSDATAPKVSVTPDSKWCPKVAVFGLSTTDEGTFFFQGNPGVDVTKINDAFTNATTQAQLGDLLMLGLSGDALATQNGVTFGSGAADKCGGGVGIIEFGGDSKVALNVYPNPVMDNLNFDFNLDKAANAVVRITDIAGRTVKTQDLGKVKAGDHKFSINVSNLNSGLYMVEVSAEGKRFVSKFNRK